MNNHIMRGIRIEKITLNIGCGTAVKTEDAKYIVENISGGKAIITKTRKRTTFNVPKNKPIGAKVTLRNNCNAVLQRLLEAREVRLPASCFDSSGNFSFGVKEYIEVPGMEYEPKIGILGFDVCITLERPGYRVKKKKLSKKIGKRHRITKEEAMKFINEKFGVEVS